jgi:acetate---CoA ligase (ADP-forming)
MSAGSSAEKAVAHARLDRMLKPRSIAMVGISDGSPFRDRISPTLDNAEVFVVNPRYEKALGKRTWPTLSELRRPVDAAISFLPAERSTELVEEASALDVGGVVLIAVGFGEEGQHGKELEGRIAAAATHSGMPVLGPNGVGFVNVPRGISLTLAARHKRRPGGISIASQSGATLSAVGISAYRYPGCGLNLLVSTGNESVTDMADLLDYFVDDADTKAIGLVIEKIRRPREFFAAARRAVLKGKPIVALKLGRSGHTIRMAASHTGAITSDAWSYDVALRQAGISLAYDPDELVDRLALVEQLPRERWSKVKALGVIANTGGIASLTGDLALTEGLEMPALDGFADWLDAKAPETMVANPLDVATQRNAWSSVVAKYATSPELDSLLWVHPLEPEDIEAGAIRYLDEFVGVVRNVEKPCVLTNISGPPRDWITGHLAPGVAQGWGIRSTLRGLDTLGSFVRYQDALPPAEAESATIDRPTAALVAGGHCVSFAATMALLADNGIPTAPATIMSADQSAAGLAMPFLGPYVLKLADVPHRTELGAVRLNVDPADLVSAAADLRTLAKQHAVSADIAIQQMVASQGELLLGISNDSDVGPVVVAGVGGIFAELLGRPCGRVAPFGPGEARRLVNELADGGLMRGFRGSSAWDLDELARIVAALSRLASAGREWIASLDINPLIWGPEGYTAVDALLVTKENDA